MHDLHLFGIHPHWHIQGTRETAMAAFTQVIVLFFHLFVFLDLSLESQLVIGHNDLDFLRLDTGE